MGLDTDFPPRGRVVQSKFEVRSGKPIAGPLRPFNQAHPFAAEGVGKPRIFKFSSI